MLNVEQQASPDDPWTESDFRFLMPRKVVGCFVASHNYSLVGFVVYGFNKRVVRLCNVSVLPEYRNEGIGSRLVKCVLLGCCESQNRPCSAVIHESNLGGQKFLRSLGFAATAIHRGYFADGDGYLMEVFP